MVYGPLMRWRTTVSACIRSLDRSPAFTLVELLVVVAILAILAALLFPVYERIRLQGEMSKSMSNLQLIGRAFHLHANDHNGLIPTYRPTGTGGSFYGSYLTPYLGRPWSAVRCPTFDRLHRASGASSAQPYTYGMNSLNTVRPFINIMLFEKPSRNFLAANINWPNQGHGSRVSASEAEKSPSQMGFHYGGRALALFVDGGVRPITIDEVPPFAARRPSHARHAEYREFWDGYRGTGLHIK